MHNKYAKNLQKAIIDRESENEVVRAAVMKRVRNACSEAAKKFVLKRIFLAGSIVSGGFSENSDVDIVIEGLDKINYFGLCCFLEENIGRKIDLIMREDLSEADEKHLLREREIVYDSEKN